MIGPPLFGKILDMTGNQYGISWIVVAVLMLIGAIALMIFAKEKT
jgi:cyanate permease